MAIDNRDQLEDLQKALFEKDDQLKKAENENRKLKKLLSLCFLSTAPFFQKVMHKTEKVDDGNSVMLSSETDVHKISAIGANLFECCDIANEYGCRLSIRSRRQEVDVHLTALYATSGLETAIDGIEDVIQKHQVLMAKEQKRVETIKEEETQKQTVHPRWSEMPFVHPSPHFVNYVQKRSKPKLEKYIYKSFITYSFTGQSSSSVPLKTYEPIESSMYSQWNGRIKKQEKSIKKFTGTIHLVNYQGKANEDEFFTIAIVNKRIVALKPHNTAHLVMKNYLGKLFFHFESDEDLLQVSTILSGFPYRNKDKNEQSLIGVHRRLIEHMIKSFSSRFEKPLELKTIGYIASLFNLHVDMYSSLFDEVM